MTVMSISAARGKTFPLLSFPHLLNTETSKPSDPEQNWDVPGNKGALKSQLLSAERRKSPLTA